MKQVHLQKQRSRSSCGRGLIAAAALCVAVAAACLTAPSAAHAASRYQPVTASVPVEVELKGDKPSEQLESTFVMTPAADEEVAPEQDTVSVTGAGKAAFTLTYDKVGEHHYTVTQTTKAADGWTLDAQTYDVTAYCMWDETTDELFTKVIVKDADGYKDESCLFTNSYKAPELPSTGGDESKKPAEKKPSGVLPSTGDAAMLPVTVACAVGVVALGAGVLVLRKRRENN